MPQKLKIFHQTQKNISNSNTNQYDNFKTDSKAVFDSFDKTKKLNTKNKMTRLQQFVPNIFNGSDGVFWNFLNTAMW